MSLRIEHLKLQLAGVSLQVTWSFDQPVTGLYAPSGSGKTTLLEIIAGLRKPDAGVIYLAGKKLDDVSQRIHLPPNKRHMGYVPQDLALFPHLNASQNLHYGVQPADDFQSEWLEKIIHTLELSPLLHRNSQKLSGGEKQRLALGRALLTRPKLLILDEPLSSLDERLKNRIIQYLIRIRNEFHIPMIYVSHHKDEHHLLCDELLTIEDGLLKPHPIN